MASEAFPAMQESKQRSLKLLARSGGHLFRLLIYDLVRIMERVDSHDQSNCVWAQKLQVFCAHLHGERNQMSCLRGLRFETRVTCLFSRREHFVSDLPNSCFIATVPQQGGGDVVSTNSPGVRTSIGPNPSDHHPLRDIVFVFVLVVSPLPPSALPSLPGVRRNILQGRWPSVIGAMGVPSAFVNA